MDGTSWRARLEALLANLQGNPAITVIDAELGAPATEAEVAQVRAVLGFELAPELLAYFRSCNGCRIAWVEAEVATRSEAIATFQSYRWEGGSHGAIAIPTLAELVARSPWCGSGTPGVQVPILGGWDDVALRATLRRFDDEDYLMPPDTPYSSVVLVLSSRYPDPVVLLADDHGAALADHRPMRARGYLELIATIGGTRERWAWFGAYESGERPIVELARGDLGDHVAGSRDFDQRFASSAVLAAAKRRVGLLPPLLDDAPPRVERARWTPTRQVAAGPLQEALAQLELHEHIVPSRGFVTLMLRGGGVIDLVDDPIVEVETNVTAARAAVIAPVLQAHGLTR